MGLFNLINTIVWCIGMITVITVVPKPVIDYRYWIANWTLRNAAKIIEGNHHKPNFDIDLVIVSPQVVGRELVKILVLDFFRTDLNTDSFEYLVLNVFLDVGLFVLKISMIYKCAQLAYNAIRLSVSSLLLFLIAWYLF